MKYEKQLIDWINIGLNKKKLAEVVETIKREKRLNVEGGNYSNRKYLEKILREEVEKQFSNINQPYVQVILNDLDARPVDATDYQVHVRVRRGKFSSADNGKGMTLDEILRLLIIPFSTEKDPIETYGWRGVGFLSTFHYCSIDNNTRVIVETSTGDESYKISFYLKYSKKLEDIMMSIEPFGKRRFTGTRVSIKGKLPAPKFDVKDYIMKQIDTIPEYVAKIYLNRKQINMDKNAKWYSTPIEFDIKGKKLKQNAGIKINNSNEIKLTSQGVEVKTFQSNYLGAAVSFPTAVKVVEGWDDFKQDASYKKGLYGIFQALEKNIDDERKNKDEEEFVIYTSEMADFMPSLASAFGMTNIREIPNLDNIRDKLLKEKKYALTYEQFEFLLPFLGDELRKTAFKASPEGCSYWRELYGNELDVIRDLKVVDVYTPSELGAKIDKDPGYYPNLNVLANLRVIGLREEIKAHKIMLVEAPPRADSGILLKKEGNERTLYANVYHEHVKGKFSAAKSYSLLSDFSHLPLVCKMRGALKTGEAAETFVSQRIEDLALK